MMGRVFTVTQLSSPDSNNATRGAAFEVLLKLGLGIGLSKHVVMLTCIKVTAYRCKMCSARLRARCSRIPSLPSHIPQTPKSFKLPPSGYQIRYILPAFQRMLGPCSCTETAAAAGVSTNTKTWREARRNTRQDRRIFSSHQSHNNTTHAAPSSCNRVGNDCARTTAAWTQPKPHQLDRNSAFGQSNPPQSVNVNAYST